MERLVEAEWLDRLPPNDNRAVRSRQDLRRLNYLMGHVGMMARLFHRAAPAGNRCHLAALGAGDGTFTLELVRHLSPRFRFDMVTLVDRLALLSAETHASFVELGCTVEAIRGDVFTWLQNARPATVITANLFLHHFTDDSLATLLKLAAERSEVFIACEPRRSWLSRTGSGLLGLLGCNGVTRHDAVVSVRAGFAQSEISRLWPESGRWALEERHVRLVSHWFLARRLAKS